MKPTVGCRPLGHPQYGRLYRQHHRVFPPDVLAHFVVPHFKVEAKHARLAGVFSLYQALKRRRSELAQTLLIGRWRPMSSFDKSQTKKKKRKTAAHAPCVQNPGRGWN